MSGVPTGCEDLDDYIRFTFEMLVDDADSLQITTEYLEAFVRVTVSGPVQDLLHQKALMQDLQSILSNMVRRTANRRLSLSVLPNTSRSISASAE